MWSQLLCPVIIMATMDDTLKFVGKCHWHTQFQSNQVWWWQNDTQWLQLGMMCSGLIGLTNVENMDKRKYDCWEQYVSAILEGPLFHVDRSLRLILTRPRSRRNLLQSHVRIANQTLHWGWLLAFELVSLPPEHRNTQRDRDTKQIIHRSYQGDTRQ